MCWFLYLAVTPAAWPLVKAWQLSRLGIRVQRSALEEGHIPNGLTVLQVSRGGCSCAWVAPQAGGAEGSARRGRDLRRGWSAAKTERALQPKSGQAIQRPADAVRAQPCEALAQLAERAGPVYAYARWEGRGASPPLAASRSLPPNELRRLGCIPGHTRLVIADRGQPGTGRSV